MAECHSERGLGGSAGGLEVSFLRPVLSDRDEAAKRAAVTFLEGRLKKKETVDWALRIRPGERIKLLAILEILSGPEGTDLREPWRSTWRLIQESWNEPAVDRYGIQPVMVQDRIRSGERSGELVSAIVDLVAPRLRVEGHQSWHTQFYGLREPPRTFRDLLLATITSGDEIHSNSRELANALVQLDEGDFLLSVANALDAAVLRGLDIARRIGWMRVHLYLRRVYYLSGPESGEEDRVIDGGGQGFAPSVKLLHAVVSRLFDIDGSWALGFVSRWKHTDSPMHLRLWAAMSRDSRITPADEIGKFLRQVDYGVFWDVYHHPEIAELRARRFAELDEATQKAVIRRIRSRPPRKSWPGHVGAEQIEQARLYWVLRELKRIETAGATLPEYTKEWLDSKIGQFSDLVAMDRIDEGFLDLDIQRGEWVTERPDGSLDSLQGADRLYALESGLSGGSVASRRASWEFKPSADVWLAEKSNSISVLNDLESTADCGAQFPLVWERFGWLHRPASDPNQQDEAHALNLEAHRMLALILELSDDVIAKAIQGLSSWLEAWKKHIFSTPNWQVVWHRFWPKAVEATNGMQPPDEEPDLNVVAQTNSDDPMDLDTLNTPVGRLVGVFLAACPNLNEEPCPFEAADDLADMRERIIHATERSSLIAKHRMIEALDYFLRSDEEWTKEHLIEPLRADDSEALALWRAVGRRTRVAHVLSLIGNDMAFRATDLRLGRKTRRSLAFSIVIDSLHALRRGREPKVTRDRVQQMIRLLEDEVRAYCAGAIVRFVNAEHQPPGPVSEEDLFESVARPFFESVWPQERSLASSAVSKELARLPAAAGKKFDATLTAIERFLTPFDCWSLRSYDLHSTGEGPTLAMIDEEPKAKALLRLLDLTISRADNATVPYYLGDALEQIRRIAPSLVQSQAYRRLATAARRQ